MCVFESAVPVSCCKFNVENRMNTGEAPPGASQVGHMNDAPRSPGQACIHLICIENQGDSATATAEDRCMVPSGNVGRFNF